MEWLFDPRLSIADGVLVGVLVSAASDVIRWAIRRRR